MKSRVIKNNRLISLLTPASGYNDMLNSAYNNFTLQYFFANNFPAALYIYKGVLASKFFFKSIGHW
jgi:hypothetical protein